jgi:hypothetical protein
MIKNIILFFKHTFVDLAKQFRLSYMPPLMIYVAAGVSGLTGIVGMFFIKDYLNLSAAFLAGLGFWAGIPWVLKMPLGHLVDLIWRHKNYLVFLGAGLIAVSLGIMYGLIIHTKEMADILTVETWFVISVILSPVGYVIQDVVADAMTVEAVPVKNSKGKPFSKDAVKLMHTTMQTLGRFAIIGGTVLVAVANIIIFSNTEGMSEADKVSLYGSVYLYALIIPFVSVLGVLLSFYLKLSGNIKIEKTKVNWWILGGSFVFVVFTISIGSFRVPFAQEIVFLGSMSIVLFLMMKLIKELPQKLRFTIVGTAIIVFVFRAMPGPGPGLVWFEIDELKFDEQFFSKLSLIASVLTLFGIIIFRSFMANNSIARIIIILSIAGAVLFLPSVGMYYGLHQWTASVTNNIVDARFIAIINTALESPLGQVAMIPMLAWIAKNAPSHLKATFFAVFASFTNLALSANSLGTKYLNQIFTITREVKDKITGVIQSTADYSELGILLIVVTLLTLIIPIITVNVIQKSKYKTNE